MKKMKSIAVGLLLASLLAGSAFALSFPDVDSNSPYGTAVAYISELGVMVGDTQGNFNPDQIVSRAEMATIVCRVLGQTETLSNTTFTDVPATHWANGSIGKASALGIVNGYGGGKFGPGDSVTYEQAITMIVRAIGEEGKATSYGGYPNGFLQAAQEKNLLNGIPATQGQGLSRGAVAVLLYNYYNGHTHSWATRHIDEVGHTEPSSGTHIVRRHVCACGNFEVWSDDPEFEAKRNVHYDPFNNGCAYPSTVWEVEKPNDPTYVVDVPAHDETYCTICRATK